MSRTFPPVTMIQIVDAFLRKSLQIVHIPTRNYTKISRTLLLGFNPFVTMIQIVDAFLRQASQPAAELGGHHVRVSPSQSGSSGNENVRKIRLRRKLSSKDCRWRILQVCNILFSLIRSMATSNIMESNTKTFFINLNSTRYLVNFFAVETAFQNEIKRTKV